MKRVNKNLICYIIAFTSILIITSNLNAATLTISSSSGSPGEKSISVPIPINLTSAPGEQVCGFNFDLNFDTSKLSFKEVTLGSVAVGAGKSLSFSQPKSNTIRVVVVGLNQNTISDGVVLNFTFDILSKAPAGKAEFTITKPSLSDPNGKALAVNISDGELDLLR